MPAPASGARARGYASSGFTRLLDQLHDRVWRWPSRRHRPRTRRSRASSGATRAQRFSTSRSISDDARDVGGLDDGQGHAGDAVALAHERRDHFVDGLPTFQVDLRFPLRRTGGDAVNIEDSERNDTSSGFNRQNISSS